MGLALKVHVKQNHQALLPAWGKAGFGAGGTSMAELGMTTPSLWNPMAATSTKLHWDWNQD
jgi:hypothetical protein